MKENSRLVALIKCERCDDEIVWDITLDGVDTGVYITQELMEDIHARQAGRLDAVNEIVEAVEDLLAGECYHITEIEKRRLNKLLQCMT